ncbi:hypothetical protein [Cupriavidus taiwanensis]|uniref:hypothetical protein n=1 Tax=Cupriavidus taiwanensis TaxID=164546 RepID=UPI000E101D19|nr:hypothetical protein [Cupriavidus taiwanensis]SOY56804.1 hypothetical protein CBM2592_A90099 [Cupriavidus taiwanensis]SOY90705.1 hypothetical protein CBM2591_A90098 [Cupriavidus taiwanensis]SOZ63511.1 hypothetical protein CBM2617_A70075 [Cupriavidus taiwanensis]SOZ82518.1 hypothetical protein CBM2618_A80075 [Cupriavidus taiwanensis]SOZ84396.1 hypothetical protein CBM2622_A80075 [Cupriavidus taiwanensis]
MKMARASEADMEAALDVSRILGDLEKGYMPASDDDEEDEGETWFDRDDAEQCKAVLGKLLDAADKGSIFRVIFGMAVVLDPRNELLDPAADSLEKHPKITAIETDASRYRWLREQHWNTADMAVVCRPKESVKLGFDCPSGQRLDEAIDAALATKDPS